MLIAGGSRSGTAGVDERKAPRIRAPFAFHLCSAWLLRRSQPLDLARHHSYARHVLGPVRVAIHLLCEFVECRGTRRAALPLRRIECTRDGGRAIGGETVVAHELVEVRAHHRERRRPAELRLALPVVLLPPPHPRPPTPLAPHPPPRS